MIVEWQNVIYPKNYNEESLQKWYDIFRSRLTFYGPDRNEFGKDLFETYLKIEKEKEDGT